MGMTRGGKAWVKVARTYRGLCGDCHQPIMPGQAYERVGGTNSKNQYLAHYNCHKPSNAPTWEELQGRYKE